MTTYPPRVSHCIGLHGSRVTDPRTARIGCASKNHFRLMAAVVVGAGDDKGLPEEALSFLRATRGSMIAALKTKVEVRGNQVVLFRGVRDELAQTIQLALNDKKPATIPEGAPASYTTSLGVATAFARKGHVPGVVYSADIDMDELVFYDHERRWNEADLDLEEEVVVFHPEPYRLAASNVVCSFVEVGVHPHERPRRRRNGSGGDCICARCIRSSTRAERRDRSPCPIRWAAANEFGSDRESDLRVNCVAPCSEPQQSHVSSCMAVRYLGVNNSLVPRLIKSLGSAWALSSAGCRTAEAILKAWKLSKASRWSLRQTTRR